MIQHKARESVDAMEGSLVLLSYYIIDFQKY